MRKFPFDKLEFRVWLIYEYIHVCVYSNLIYVVVSLKIYYSNFSGISLYRKVDIYISAFGVKSTSRSASLIREFTASIFLTSPAQKALARLPFPRTHQKYRNKRRTAHTYILSLSSESISPINPSKTSEPRKRIFHERASSCLLYIRIYTWCRENRKIVLYNNI